MRYIIVVNEVDLNGEYFSEASVLGGPWRTIKRAEQDMREHFAALVVEDGHLIPGSSYKLFKLDKGHSTLEWEMFMTDLKEEMYPIEEPAMAQANEGASHDELIKEHFERNKSWIDGIEYD